MTSNDLNDLQKMKCFNYGFMHIKRKLGTPGVQLQQRIQWLTFYWPLTTSNDLNDLQK